MKVDGLMVLKLSLTGEFAFFFFAFRAEKFCLISFICNLSRFNRIWRLPTFHVNDWRLIVAANLKHSCMCYFKLRKKLVLEYLYSSTSA